MIDRKKIVWRFLLRPGRKTQLIEPFEERCPRIHSPVAEANSSVFLLIAGVLLLMPGTLREIQTSCPACHFAFRTMQKVFPALDGFSFIPPSRPECKGMFAKLVRGVGFPGAIFRNSQGYWSFDTDTDSRAAILWAVRELRRSARMQPMAQAAGNQATNKPAPKGRKKK